MDTLNVKLDTICFLDATSLGFVVPILANHIFALGGSHTVLGILAGLHFLFQLTAVPLIRTLKQTYGTKQVLISTLLLQCTTYLFLATTSSCLCVVLLRLIYAVTSQTQTLCKELASESGLPAERQQEVYNVMNAMSVAGVICGPIVGGYMYDFEGGFFYIALLSSTALLLSALIAATLPRRPKNETSSTSFFFKVNEGFETSCKIANCCDLKRQWAPVLLKVLYHSSTTIFFIKFSLLLKANYDVSTTVIGFTYAYQNILTFLAQFVPLYLNPKRRSHSYTLFLSSVTLSMLGLCFAPSYDFYLIAFMPMIVAHTFINGSWKEVYSVQSTPENDIAGLDDVVAKCLSIFVPVIFGLLCDLYGHRALQTFVTLPLAVAAVISASTKILEVKPRDDSKID